MKKIVIIALAVAAMAVVAGCSKKEGDKKAADSRPTIRLVTDATGMSSTEKALKAPKAEEAFMTSLPARLRTSTFRPSSSWPTKATT